jgi:hypothetical protein
MAIAMTHDQLMRMQASGRVYQERFDNALQPWDRRAPAPTLGQSIDTYRRDVLVGIKKLLPDGHELRQIQIRRMPQDVLDAFEPQLLQACRAEAYNPTTVPPGEFRRVVEVNANNGLKTVRFVGHESFVKEMGRPGRRVVSFTTPHGRVNAAGTPVR